ncbi:ATP-dependent DNA helicase [Vallitalea sp.]|jgi:DNA excision repair protein ERCC-2|uniref:ATP-dependent DNA helicase n=1 Tax=Vallitalea sp. TaxID=1882829 RepID=UPI0025F77C75|nr:ATP-dependent DNA helicase [Vallitalea sp.]MCT4688075.1 ATP-dependent DNA helicase [Vallitalea sp.]
MSSNKLSISVRELIEFVLRSGDIKSVFLSSSRAVDGIKAHQKIQKRFSKEYDAYEWEVPIKDKVSIDDIELDISGRIDGIIFGDTIIIDEIKSVNKSLENIDENYNKLHLAQGKMYAYMYGKQKNVDKLIVRLTYVELGNYAIKQFQNEFTLKELEEFYYSVINLYIDFAKKIINYNSLRDKSIKDLQFPFDSFRRGQRKFMNSVYKVIMEDEKLFARAPTGIGKTIGTLYPAIKSMEKKNSKIFYLTAKTIGRDVAEKAIKLLEGNGLKLKRVLITAKDKICLNEEKKCDSKYCKYAKGHYDRINSAIGELLTATDNYSRDTILEYSKKYQLCPYELTLDLALFSDCIICDYNYAFDPSAVLKRFFVEGNGSYIFLIDEAHNLVDRAREMYSATMYKKPILKLRRIVKDIDKILYKYLGKLNSFMIEKRRECEIVGDFIVEEYYSEDFVDILRGIIHRTEKIFANLVEWEHMDELLDFYFDSYDFVKKAELYDDRYITYYEKIQDDVLMKLFCLDPSGNLRDYMGNAKSTVLFSATLTPMDYFVKILGGNEKNYGLTLESPFEQKNLCLLINNKVSTKYKNRQKTYINVVETIYNTIKGKKGNYIIFFPSYKYMNDVYDTFINIIEDDDINIIKQERGLSESEKDDFLGEFHNEREGSFVAFAVLGGMFGEGIDLTGEKLSGAVIVGVGLPSICNERNLIKNYFDNTSDNGFEYAYMYPGMNKVMQAAGRVIRTMSDVGIVVLIDERFGSNYYKRIFPYEWNHAVYASSDLLKEKVDDFWENI